MELLSPAQLGWLGLAAPLILLYVLRRRRQEREVASTLLWELALRDLRAERPWKRLVPHLSLLLQLLIVIAGAIALARPVGAGRIVEVARLAVVIDTSPSMAARMDAVADETRLDHARAVALDLARSLPPGGELMIVEAASEATVVTSFTSDAVALERALDGLRLRGGRADVEGAVALAVERLRGASSSRVVLLTDAAIDGEVALDRRSTEVEVRRIGREVANTAIVAMDVRPRPDEAAPDRADVFVRLAHFDPQPAGAAADVFVTASVDGRGVVASRRVRVEPGETESVILPADLPPDASGRPAVVRVELSRPDGARPFDALSPDALSLDALSPDALSLDNVAVAPSPGARRLPVFLVGGPIPSVERVFRADPEVELFATTLGALAAREDPAPLDGLIVYAGEVPDRPPRGDSIVIAPTGSQVFEVGLGPAASSPRVVNWDEDDPRLRFVTMSELHLGTVRPILGPTARPLVTTDVGVAIATLQRPDGETTLVAFDPATSDWPRQPSFVVFFRNLIERARQRRQAGGVVPGGLGEPLRIPAPEDALVEVQTPAGATLTARSRGGVAIVSVPVEPGVFQVTVDDRRLHALRNLLDSAESDLSPRARFTRAGESATGEVVEAETHRESWPWFVGALLLVLLLEALWATRRDAT